MAAALLVHTPTRTTLISKQEQTRAAHATARASRSNSGFSQPGYNPRNPKGLWGKGVPQEYREDDYKLIKSLSVVEQDLNSDSALMSQMASGLELAGLRPAGLRRVANGQQLAVGGVDIEGGQGESDSIFGSHDDHSTYGVAGSGWQGYGNGEAPGDLWNSAVRPNMRIAPGQQLAVGGVDIEGGQGEADSIFGSHDDHSTYGVAGSGWQGYGNGEEPGDLWNSAIRPRDIPPQRVTAGQKLRQITHPYGIRIPSGQSLAGGVPYPAPGCCENGWCYCRIDGE